MEIKKQATKQDGNQPIFQFQNAIQQYQGYCTLFFHYIDKLALLFAQ